MEERKNEEVLIENFGAALAACLTEKQLESTNIWDVPEEDLKAIFRKMKFYLYE